jgi:hypothetical protein
MSGRSRRPRLSIEERAARRDYVLSRGRDRFTALLRILQAGREMPIVPRDRFDVDWQPWAWRVAKVALAVAGAWLIFGFASTLARDLRVDTWNGPDATVQSGQRLAGCATVNVMHDDDYPTWVRYGGAVFQLLRTLVPVSDPATGATGLTESGYSLGQMRLLTEGPASTATERGRILVILPPARAAQVYAITPECH